MLRGRAFAALAASLLVAVGLTTFVDGSPAGTVSTPSARELAAGRALFQNVSRDNLRCSFCHTLRSADARGGFAVDLDAEFSIDRQQGWSDARIRKEVLSYIAKPPCFEPTNPNRCMPSEQYTGAKAAMLATFVATCAGRSSKLPACRPVPGGLRGAAARGQELYLTNGCASCHWSAGGKSVGPSLYGVYGSRVRLAGGKTAVADDAYLLESILAPDAKVVAGYPKGFMSARLRPGEVTAAQARDLVTYLKTLK